MSLFRVGLVLSLGIAVMPSDQAQQAKLYENAASAAHWTMTFCDRNGPTCETASVVWATFLQKAEFAGQLAYDVASRYMSGDSTAAVSPAVFSSDKNARPAGRGTLSSDDLKPAWRGATGRQGV